jgi:hypothetical protein
MQKEIHLVHDRACFSRVCVVDRFSTDWMLVVVCVRAIVAMSVCLLVYEYRQIANRRQ